jgi:hypothetical protein
LIDQISMWRKLRKTALSAGALLNSLVGTTRAREYWSDYSELDELQRAVLCEWITLALTPAKTPDPAWPAYTLKTVAERECGFYISNEALKTAMVIAGAEPVVLPSDPKNWRFKIRPSNRPRRRGQWDDDYRWLWMNRCTVKHVTGEDSAAVLASMARAQTREIHRSSLLTGEMSKTR